MDSSFERKKPWLSEVEEFISYWNQATHEIKSRVLNPEECNDISEMFQHDSDELLLRRPDDILDDQVVTRLEQLDNQLSTSLAMACKIQSTKKRT